MDVLQVEWFDVGAQSEPEGAVEQRVRGADAACCMAIERLEPHANASTLHFNPAAQSLLDRARVSKSLLASKSSMGCPWTQWPGVQVLKKKE